MTIAEYLMLTSEDDLSLIRERIADQQAVIELIELRGYTAMLPAAKELLAALEMARGNIERLVAADRRWAGIQ